jgi:hypothetical protein
MNYQLKSCPHCGSTPVVLTKKTCFVITCTGHPDFEVLWPSEDLSVEELVEAIDDWNEDFHFIQLGADPSMVQSRRFSTVTIATTQSPDPIAISNLARSIS